MGIAAYTTGKEILNRAFKVYFTHTLKVSYNDAALCLKGRFLFSI